MSESRIISSVIFTATQAVAEGVQPPIQIKMSATNMTEFEREKKTFDDDVLVNLALEQVEVSVDESCPDNEIYACVPMH
ncbi:hypothetical protein [Vibrio rotiferianus]|nr:hypothetical protein [Vibrio rotiferianus]